MLSKTQRQVIAGVIERAERGPSFGPANTSDTSREYERRARIWAETWVADMLRGVLANDTGDMSAAELRSIAGL